MRDQWGAAERRASCISWASKAETQVWGSPGRVGKSPAGPEPLTAHLPADLPDDADAARPQAALLEKHLLGGEKQPPSTGQGPVFYIGGTNGASV